MGYSRIPRECFLAFFCVCVSFFFLAFQATCLPCLLPCFLQLLPSASSAQQRRREEGGKEGSIMSTSELGRKKKKENLRLWTG
ncbi:hypothetical protein HOY80DRAFT_994852 [Tuber brumale]|nr:hypothetical protein HOY80DRAFT_994852 [Tuber brumale]